MNLEEINNTIEALENSSTTFGNCEKLASLYICRDHMMATHPDSNPAVEKEYNDILPQYQQYCTVKRRYQLHEITEEPVIASMMNVCTEIKEFIQILYSNTNMENERIQIHNMLTELSKKF